MAKAVVEIRGHNLRGRRILEAHEDLMARTLTVIAIAETSARHLVNQLKRDGPMMLEAGVATQEEVRQTKRPGEGACD